MPRKPSGDSLPPRLEELRDRLEHWRSDPERRKRIPKEIWSFAVELTRDFGVGRTSRSAALDFTTLKKRALEAGVAAAPAKRRPKKRTTASTQRTFVELRPSALEPSSSCLVEIEDPAGAKMRFHLGTPSATMLTALARSFLRAEG